MGDEISADIGDDTGAAVIGKKNQQQSNDQRNDPRLSQQAGNTYFSGGNADYNTLWARFFELAQLLRENTVVTNSNEKRISRLEDVEIEVRAHAVFVRAKPPESSNIPPHLLFTIGIAVAVLVLLAVSFLVYLQVAHGV